MMFFEHIRQKDTIEKLPIQSSGEGIADRKRWPEEIRVTATQITLPLAILLCFTTCFVSASLNRVTWSHGTIEMLFIIYYPTSVKNGIFCCVNHSAPR